MTRSLSNLYKAQVNRNKGEAYTRVIDHNELLEQKLTALSFERMAQLRRQQEELQNGEASGGEAKDGADGTQPAGFTEGIAGMAFSVSPELEIDYVERAKEEADQIVSKATADGACQGAGGTAAPAAGAAERTAGTGICGAPAYDGAGSNGRSDPCV